MQKEVLISADKNDELKDPSNDFVQFFDHSSEPMFIIGEETDSILKANLAAVQFYGYSDEEFATMSLTDLDNHRECGQIIKIMEGIANKSHLTKNKMPVFVALKKQSIHINNKKYQIVRVNDITLITLNITKRNEFVHNFSASLLGKKTFFEYLHDSIKITRKLLGWDVAEVWLPSLDETKMERKVLEYDSEKLTETIKHALENRKGGVCHFGECYKKECKINQPYIYNNYEGGNFCDSQKKAMTDLQFKSLFHVPVVREGKTICNLFFFSFSIKSFKQFDLDIANIAGNLMGSEITKKRVDFLLNQFFNISHDIMILKSIDSDYIKVNKAFEKFIGLKENEINTEVLLKQIHPDDRFAIIKKAHKLHKGIADPYFESRIVLSNGAVKWIAWSAVKFEAEGIIFISGKEITKRKEAEVKLLIANKRYHYVTEATQDAIWDYNIEKNEVIWTRGYKNLFGHDHTIKRIGYDFWESNLHPDEKDAVIQSFYHFINQKDTRFWNCEYRFRRSNETYANVIDKGFLIFDKENKPVRVVGSMRDISKEKEMEQILLKEQKEKQLEITKAVVEAQEKERAEIGNELHDNVCQLVTTLKLYFDVIAQKDSAVREIALQGRDIANRAVTDARLLSRYLAPPRINHLGLIASITDLIDNYSIVHSITITLFAEKYVAEFKMNEAAQLAFYRIVQESLNNIFKYAKATEVKVNLFREDENIVMAIIDNGVGFNLKKVKNGLGLKNIKSRAELLNGITEIVTEPGKGCTITVCIPGDKCILI